MVRTGQHALPRQYHLGSVCLKIGGGDALHQRLPLGGTGTILSLPGLLLQGGQRGFRAQGIEGGFGRPQFGLEVVFIQPEVEAETDALATAHQLDAGQHETAGAKPLPAGLGRIERQSAIVARAVVMMLVGCVRAHLLDGVRLGQFMDGAQRDILGTSLSTGLPVDAGIEGLRREPAQKGADFDRHSQPYEAADVAVTQGVQLLLDMGLSQHGFLSEPGSNERSGSWMP